MDFSSYKAVLQGYKLRDSDKENLYLIEIPFSAYNPYLLLTLLILPWISACVSSSSYASLSSSEIQLFCKTKSLLIPEVVSKA